MHGCAIEPQHHLTIPRTRAGRGLVVLVPANEIRTPRDADGTFGRARPRPREFSGQDCSAPARRRAGRHREQGSAYTLVQCAWAAKNKKGSYLQAQFRRLLARRGPQKAICAVAASILTAAYHMLKDGIVYEDLGPDHFSRRSKTTHAQRLVRQLQRIGYAVDIKPMPA
jgi:hypothetical protein